MQKEIAEKSRNDLQKENVYNDSIVTEITPFKNFYVAEDYHQDYFAKNPDQGYCAFVVAPKLDKFKKVFKDKLKKNIWHDFLVIVKQNAPLITVN